MSRPLVVVCCPLTLGKSQLVGQKVGHREFHAKVAFGLRS